MRHVPLHVRQTTQCDNNGSKDKFPAAPCGSLGLVKMSERPLSQPLNLAIWFRDWLITRESRPVLCTAPNRGESTSTLPAKLVIGRISLLAKGTTDILVCPGVDF